MKVTFVSNYINHHQIPVSDVLYEKLGNDYTFIQTEPMEEERIKMGWGTAFDDISYLKKYYENEYECQKLIATSDVVIFGGTEREELIEDRLLEGKPIIRYSERLYKEGQWKCISPRGLVKKYHDHTRYSDAPVYLLCSGGYVADDFNIIKAYNGKRFKWGYFPRFIEYSEEERKARRDERRSHGVLEILWAGRLIDWKHPESCIVAAKGLKEAGIDFRIDIIGDGDMKENLENQINAAGQGKNICLLGQKNPDEVRSAMNRADIFFFTSDYKEGWGAVCNEAMNAGCAVLASHAAGAVPTLITHRQNGIVYPYGDNKKMVAFLKEMAVNQKWRLSLGETAYETLRDEWNHKTAAERLYNLCNQVMKNEVVFCESGPLSEANVIHQRKMYKKLVGVE